MLITNQNHPDFVKNRFLLAGFHCASEDVQYKGGCEEVQYISGVSSVQARMCNTSEIYHQYE